MEEAGSAPDVIEHGFACPYCGEPITMLLDPGSGLQEYVEDCEVCCNPIGLRVRVEEGFVTDFEARPLEQ
jgi:hypothetical protein